jgi:hypothetical protein
LFAFFSPRTRLLTTSLLQWATFEAISRSGHHWNAHHRVFPPTNLAAPNHFGKLFVLFSILPCIMPRLHHCYCSCSYTHALSSFVIISIVVSVSCNYFIVWQSSLIMVNGHDNTLETTTKRPLAALLDNTLDTTTRHPPLLVAPMGIRRLKSMIDLKLY